MGPKEDVLASYIVATSCTSLLLFGLKNLLLMDSASSRISKAAEYVRPVEIAAWVFTWYGVSVSMVMANRWFFHDWQGVGFPFPVLTTMAHMWLKFFVTRIVFRMKGNKPPPLDMSISWKAVIPIGLTTAGDILLSNLSFMFCTVTFYTIVKSGSLAWIMLWAVAFKFEVLTFETVLVVTLMSAGLCMASLGETEFSLLGMIMILSASCLSGLRWALVQLLQSVEPACSDPMLVIYYIAPSSALAMTPMALLDILNEDLKDAHFTPAAIAEVVALIFWTGMFSFALIFAEVKLLSMTSGLSMGVFGTVKELIQIAIAVLIFGDHFTILKVGGLSLALIGSILYKISRTEPNAPGEARGSKDDRQTQDEEGVVWNAKGNAGVLLLPYSAVSQQEVDEELRVFKYNNTEWELEGELEEFSSFEGVR